MSYSHLSMLVSPIAPYFLYNTLLGPKLVHYKGNMVTFGPDTVEPTALSSQAFRGIILLSLNDLLFGS